MWTKRRSAKSFPIVYCILWPPYSRNLPTPNYRHRSHAQWTESIQISLWKRTDWTYWCKRIEDFGHFYPLVQRFKASLLSKSTKLSNTWHTATGKGRHNTGYTPCIMDTSVLWTLQCGPAVSVIQRFHCNYDCTQQKCMPHQSVCVVKSLISHSVPGKAPMGA